MFHTPKAISAEPKDAPANTLGIRRIMFAVDDIEDVIARLRANGAELVGELAQFEDMYRLCYVRGPEGIVVGLENVRCEIAMLRTPDGHGRLELDKFHTPAAVGSEPKNAPVNTLGIRRIMFAVDDIDDVIARLRTHGAELVGEVAQYEDIYRLCYLRGPEGIIVALAEQLN